jgi:hypothetical protein
MLHSLSLTHIHSRLKQKARFLPHYVMYYMLNKRKRRAENNELMHTHTCAKGGVGKKLKLIMLLCMAQLVVAL